MAHHERVRDDLTAWSSGAVAPSEFDELDSNAFKSINGDEGGVWAPSEEAIEIGGMGLIVSGPFEASGTINLGDTTVDGQVTADELLVTGPAVFNGNVTLGNSVADFLEVNAEAAFNNTLTIGENATDVATINSTLVVNGPVGFASTSSTSFAGGLSVASGATFTAHGTAVFNGNVTIGNAGTDTLLVVAATEFDGDVDLDGDIDFGPTSVITGQPTLGVRLRYQDTGRVPWRVTVGADASDSYLPRDTDIVFVPAGTLTTSRTYTIDDTGCVDGDHILFVVRETEGGRTLNIETPGDADNVSLIGIPSGALDAEYPLWAQFVRVSGSWRCVGMYRATLDQT